MNALLWYLAGVSTLPALAALVAAGNRAATWLASKGITVEAKRRELDKISQFVIDHDIWWERSFGPVFVGGWYREDAVYDPDAPGGQRAGTRRVNRWFGFGSADGPCLMVFRARVLP